MVGAHASSMEQRIVLTGRNTPGLMVRDRFPGWRASREGYGRQNESWGDGRAETRIGAIAWPVRGRRSAVGEAEASRGSNGNVA
jgi:hypothetical protein